MIQRHFFMGENAQIAHTVVGLLVDTNEQVQVHQVVTLINEQTFRTTKTVTSLVGEFKFLVPAYRLEPNTYTVIGFDKANIFDPIAFSGIEPI